MGYLCSKSSIRDSTTSLFYWKFVRVPGGLVVSALKVIISDRKEQNCNTFIHEILHWTCVYKSKAFL